MFQGNNSMFMSMGNKSSYRLNYDWKGNHTELELIQEFEGTPMRRFTTRIVSFGKINQRLNLVGKGMIPSSLYEVVGYEDVAEVAFKTQNGEHIIVNLIKAEFKDFTYIIQELVNLRKEINQLRSMNGNNGFSVPSNQQVPPPPTMNFNNNFNSTNFVNNGQANSSMTGNNLTSPLNNIENNLRRLSLQNQQQNTDFNPVLSLNPSLSSQKFMVKSVAALAENKNFNCK